MRANAHASSLARYLEGLDLASAVPGHPSADHAAALAAARDAGLGIHVAVDARLMAEACARGLRFEVCPSSILHTGAADSLATHPLRRMLDAGLSLSISTDNRLISAVRLSEEL
jgi:adenosine deaminase